MVKIRKRSEAWKDVEDRRGQAPARGGGLALPGGAAAKLGIPGILIAIVLAVLGGSQLGGGGGGGSGVNLPDIFNQLPGAVPAEPGGTPAAPVSQEQQDLADFAANVTLDVQEYWEEQFRGAGETYERATLVFYNEGTNTGGCGFGSAAAGPFYCPADEKVYLDLDFAKELSTKFGVSGDFALAYVMAHEVGHHVQNKTGVSSDVRRQQQGKSQEKVNDLSIRLELQADCFAGAWASSAWTGDVQLEDGDIDEGLLAASRVGDDWIQKNLGSGRVNPDTWTHGSSEQRKKWFTKGYESKDPGACDTFSVKNP